MRSVPDGASSWQFYSICCHDFNANHFYFTIIFIYLAFFAPKGEEIYPIAELRDDSIATPKIFENWALWTGITIALILFAYTIPLIDIIQSAPPGSPGFKLW